MGIDLVIQGGGDFYTYIGYLTQSTVTNHKRGNFAQSDHFFFTTNTHKLTKHSTLSAHLHTGDSTGPSNFDYYGIMLVLW